MWYSPESFPFPSLKTSGYFSGNVSLFINKRVVWFVLVLSRAYTRELLVCGLLSASLSKYAIIVMPTFAFLPSKGRMTFLSTSLQSSWHLKSSRHTLTDTKLTRYCQLTASVGFQMSVQRRHASKFIILWGYLAPFHWHNVTPCSSVVLKMQDNFQTPV